jgi:penicillin G amidase
MKPIRIYNTSRPFTAARDEAGVPHIRAAGWLDALYGLGYLHGFDRGTQLLFSRSVACGRAAEQISDAPQMLETDRFFRRVGLHRHLELELDQLTPHWRDQLRAYCDGVNAGLAGLGRTLPMWAVGFEVSPWDEAAVMLVGRLLSFGGLAVSQMENERLLVQLIHAGVHDDTLKQLFAPRLDHVDFKLLRRVNMANHMSDEAMELIADLPRLAGSNAWAVRPERSATGGALFAADPHLEINRLPAIWYEAVLCWGDRQYVMGASLPGCPLFTVARTRHVAWGVTHMKGDLLDFFMEDCRCQEGVWQYRRGKKWQNFAIREEVLERKSGHSETLQALENDEGTLEADLRGQKEGIYLSMAWTGRRDGHGAAMGAWLDVIHAQDVQQAADVARRCRQPSLCWVLADRQGHIGLQGCGQFPQRGGGHLGLTPIPAWEPRNHWRGWLKESLLPRVIDPPQGYVATANEEQTATNGAMLVTQPAPDYRLHRILQRLDEVPRATVEQMQRLQYDVLSLHAHEMLKVFLPAMNDGPLKERLTAWDRRFAPDSEEASLFFRLYLNVMMETFGHARGVGWRRMLHLCSRAGYSIMILTAADRLLTNPRARWWQEHDRNEVIRRAAARMENVTVLPWSKVNTFHFTDRFFGGWQVGRILGFDSRRYAMPGCHATVYYGHVLQTAKRESTFAPSYHFVTDMSTDEAWTNLPGGPSENRFSKWYKSDVARWLDGTYKRLAPAFDEVMEEEADDELVSVPQEPGR